MEAANKALLNTVGTC